MNNKKEIIKFLEELTIGVQEKLDENNKKVGKYRDRIMNGEVTAVESQKDMDLLKYFENEYNCTDARLYEINYILGTITRDKRKKI